jgi:hypothetical protein
MTAPRQPLTNAEKDLIVARLLEKRRAGEFSGIWISGGSLFIKWQPWDDPEFLKWCKAAEMTGVREPTKQKCGHSLAFRYRKANGGFYCHSYEAEAERAKYVKKRKSVTRWVETMGGRMKFGRAT